MEEAKTMAVNNVQMLLHIALLLCAYNMACVASKAPLSKPGCQSHCGHLTEIPYPLGIGEGCYFNEHFQIICDNSTSPPKAFLNNTSVIEVLDISLEAGTLNVTSPITFSNCTNKKSDQQPPNLYETSFWFPRQGNLFISMSCGRMASVKLLNGGYTIAGCLSICKVQSNIVTRNNSCSGTNCCQATLPWYLQGFNISFEEKLTERQGDECNYAFLVDQHWFASTNISIIRERDHVPVLLEWRGWDSASFIDVGRQNWRDDNKSTYCKKSSLVEGSDKLEDQCACSNGFEGNPYLHHGCLDINECEDPERPNMCGPSAICVNYPPGSFQCRALDIIRPTRSSRLRIRLAIIVPSSVLGLLFLLVGAWWLRKATKRRKTIKRKEKFFNQNGGLLLEKQLSSGEVNVEKIKLFNSKELEKATDHFNVDRILGQGGQGTVYKGMMMDGRIVAVKKSKIVDEGEVGQFINEIVILSQISHRNVVKLLGCCLETEVPLLVYEFIHNGTLSHYIHHQNEEEFPLTWEMRVRVSNEVASALSYLHSAASFPIFHRDIKSSNILLDEKYRAKVADFGTSRSVSIDQTHLTTLVHGTFGYLDPEYLQSSQFTDKSDVYSFGVVLAELLTGQKPVSVVRSQESKSLATYFLVSMEENRLFDILDARVVKEGGRDEIVGVANLAKRCLNLKGKKRPTMKEVAVELERIQSSVKRCDVQQNGVNFEYVQSDEIMTEPWDDVSTATSSCKDTVTGTGTGSSFDKQPLLSFNSS